MDVEAAGGVAVIGAGGDGISAAGVGGGVSSSSSSSPAIGSANCFEGPVISGASSRLSGGEGEGEGGRPDAGVLVFAEVKRPGGLEIWSGSRDGGDVIIGTGKGGRDSDDKEPLVRQKCQRRYRCRQTWEARGLRY